MTALDQLSETVSAQLAVLDPSRLSRPAAAPAPRPVDEVDEVRDATSWAPVDLAAALAGITTPPPDVLARTDGVHLLYRGRVNSLQGESETLKSWAAQVAAEQVLDAGGRVLYVDFEDDAYGVVSRLLAMAVGSEAITDRFIYVRPDEPLRDHAGRITAGGIDLEAVMTSGPFDLAVIDGVTEAMTVEGLGILDNTEIARWQRLLPKRIATVTGAAVVVIDHVTKSTEGRGRFAIGGQHKLAGITGAAYAVNLLRPFARSHLEPVTGSVQLTVVKDRPGHVRGHATEGKVAVLELTSWPDGSVTTTLEPGGVEPGPDLDLARRILEHLAAYDGASQRNVCDNVEGNTDAKRSALKWMADEARNWVTIIPKGNTHLHHLTDAGREQIGPAE